ncbi:hypothetical protein C0995_013527 [Termitomyces sp. Mi166|nr:hypothetical protein C0995_013527 [Termitomyces sp. Mi166\
MGSETTKAIMANNVAYPRIRPAKLNAHWLTSIAPFDRTTGEFMKWLTKLEIFLQQSRLDRYIFAPESKPKRLVTEPNQSSEPVAHANWLANINNKSFEALQAQPKMIPADTSLVIIMAQATSAAKSVKTPGSRAVATLSSGVFALEAGWQGRPSRSPSWRAGLREEEKNQGQKELQEASRTE